jgi:hypothetical protein
VALKVGSHLRAPSTSCEVVVVRGTDDDGVVAAAGASMSTDAAAGESNPDGPVLAMGKRYTDVDSGIELLVVKPGTGPLTFADRELNLKSAKALPASD